MMLTELGLLLENARPEFSMPDYRNLVVTENVLGKPTHTTREHTARKLKALYGLDPVLPIFRILFRFWQVDEESRPLLAMLCAQARDPLLRLASPAVLKEPIGALVARQAVIDRLATEAPGRFSETNSKAIASRVLSSFEQSGHLSGRAQKVRTRAHATPLNATYAFFLAYLEGYRAQRIFSSPWARFLDVSNDDLPELALHASRRGYCDFRRVGNIVELRFPELLRPAEEEWTREH
jgi:hypothetical protein